MDKSSGGGQGRRRGEGGAWGWAFKQQDQQVMLEQLPARRERFNNTSLQLPTRKKRTTLLSSEQGDISPWAADDFRKTFQPSRYFQTIQNQYQRTHRQHHSPPLPDEGRTEGRGFLQLLKLQRKSASYRSERVQREQGVRLNLVEVNLDEDLVCGEQRREGGKSKSQSRQGKEQPVRMKIFKKIMEKNGRQGEEEMVDKADQFLQAYLTLQNDHSPLYPVLPKRNYKFSDRKRKIESIHEEPLPRVGPLAERQEEGLYCRGENIQQESGRQSKLRSLQGKPHPNNDKLLFLSELANRGQS